MSHSQAMSGVTRTQAEPAALQAVSIKKSQEQQSMQHDAGKVEHEPRREAEAENDKTSSVNEILLKLLVTSMYATLYYLATKPILDFNKFLLLSLENYRANYYIWLQICYKSSIEAVLLFTR